MSRFSVLPTADDLDAWADRPGAEEELARLVQKLILATASPAGLRIPVGKATNAPGWDGVIDVAAGNFRVPTGRSFWEWGTGPAQGKATSDYGKRTTGAQAAREADRLASAFVFVTPRHWRDPGRADWKAAKAKDAKWAQIEVWDASDLESWLEKAPVVQLWLAEVMSKPGLGDTKTLESAWEEWVGGFYPHLGTARLAVAGRTAQAEVVRGWLESGAQHRQIYADSIAEAVAFVAGSFLSSDAHEAGIQQAIVVRAPSAWDDVTAIDSQPLVLIPAFPKADASKALRRGHTVIEPVVPPQPVGTALRLPPGDRAEISLALQQMGIEFVAAELAARSSGGRLSALRRRVSRSPTQSDWATVDDARFLVPALIAGAWKDDVHGDVAALEKLAKMGYRDLEVGLQRLSQVADAPLQQDGAAWAAVAPLDAWSQVVHLAHHDHWTAFAQVALEVLGARDPAFDLPPDERWLANTKGKSRPHSDQLRHGLAENLAMIASQAEFADLKSGRTGGDVAAIAVSRLLHEANQDPSGELWASLGDQLPLLAEAAPTAFREGVSRGLEGADPVLAKLLVEEASILGSRTRVHGLLWALERLAWAPDYLSDIAVLFARLSDLDPGIKSENRPINSLMEVLLPWHPQTAADVEGRLAAVDVVRRVSREAAGRLMSRLLPTTHGIATPTARPEWRAWAPSEDRRVTNADYWRFVTGITERLIADAGTEVARWKVLVEAYDNLPDELAGKLLASLDGLDTEDLTPVDAGELHDQMLEVVGNHRAFATAEWALPAERVEKLEHAAQRFAPKDSVLEGLWLFEAHPSMERVSGRNFDEYEKDLDRLRHAAISAIYKAKGWPGIEELLAEAGSPYMVGVAVAGLDERKVEEQIGALGSRDDEASLRALQGYVYIRSRDEGWSWTEPRMRARRGQWSDERLGQILLTASDTSAAARLAAELGADVDAAFWKFFNGFPRGAALWEAARELVAHGRPFAAVQLAGNSHILQETSFEPETAYLVLDAAARATEPPAPNEVIGIDFDIAQILMAMDSAGFDEQRLADLEWVFLRVLERDPQGLKHLHRRLARDAAFFVEIVKLIWRARGEEPPVEPDPEVARYGQHAFTLLWGWKGPAPGFEGKLSEAPASLDRWIQKARDLLSDSGRVAIGDQRIGHALWYAPKGSDGIHPHEAVRDVLERAVSDDLNIGFATEAFNSRGAVYRARGGEQERDIATGYRERAASLRANYPTTARIFEGLADEYERLGRFEDERDKADQ